jgi:hypothetical protein
MSSTFTLYVVDEKALPRSLRAPTDQRTYDALVGAVKAKGARWAQVDMSIPEFARALELIDEEMGGTKFLPVLAFNNSPHNLLGDEGDAPSFGYFTPEQSSDLSASINDVSKAIEAQVADDDNAESVYHAFETSAREAVARGYGLAVLHDA